LVAGREIPRSVGFRAFRAVIIGTSGTFGCDWLQPQLGLHLSAELIVNATISAVVLLPIVKLIRDDGPGDNGWSHRWR
jgi:uncharacterized membrane protein YeaQ/YmgE (transglycosylase-associated protein family)